VVLVSLISFFVFLDGERLVFLFGSLGRAAEIHGFKRHFMR